MRYPSNKTPPQCPAGAFLIPSHPAHDAAATARLIMRPTRWARLALEPCMFYPAIAGQGQTNTLSFAALFRG